MPGSRPEPMPMLSADEELQSTAMVPEPLAHEMHDDARTMTPT